MTHPLTPILSVAQWIVVMLVPLANGKTDKIPCAARTGQSHVDAHAPQHWTDYATAAATAQQWTTEAHRFTVGFVITEQDPFWCLDIDGALQDDGTWSALAQQLMQSLPGTAVEVSQSGTGLHIWGQGPVPEHSMKNTQLHIELYSSKRFIAIGSGAVGDMTQPCPHIAGVAAALFPPRATNGLDLADEGPRADWRGPADDDELLRRALQSTSAGARFDGKATFADLFDAVEPVLARNYPPDRSSSEPFDRSSADAALFQHLAFWTGADPARMLRLARRSRLVRDKWERDDYLQRTVTHARSHCRDVLQDAPPPAPLAAAPEPEAVTLTPAVVVGGGAPSHTVAAVAAMKPRTTAAFLDAAGQESLFRGCVYIVDHHKVLCPGGRVVTPERFNVMYGGYTFVMDGQNAKTTRNAFEAFTQSQVLMAPWVDGLAFLPALPYGTIVETEGRSRANSYWPAHVRRVKGDVTPMLDHLRRLLPVPVDQCTLLYYMAHCVQHPGVKAQWWPLLVGPEGNGKSFFSRVLAYAVGKRYTHWPAADKLGAQFNAWMFGRLLYLIEDVKIADKEDLWEKLKPIITGEDLEIEGKGIDQRTDEVCGNGMLNSNHYDAIRKSANDRRIAPLFCAQQNLADMLRDGITEAYTSGLYDWAKMHDGYAICAEFLATVTIPPEYGLRWFQGRAPTTSSTDAALRVGLGRVEQEILEAIAQDLVGFRGGWVSSTFLDRLMKEDRAGHIPRQKRREIMQRLGYDWHPALTDGRVNAVVSPDEGKPRLYIHRSSPHLALTAPADVARAYSAAQKV